MGVSAGDSAGDSTGVAFQAGTYGFYYGSRRGDGYLGFSAGPAFHDGTSGLETRGSPLGFGLETGSNPGFGPIIEFYPGYRSGDGLYPDVGPGLELYPAAGSGI